MSKNKVRCSTTALIAFRSSFCGQQDGSTTNPLLAYTFHAYGRTEGVAGVIISDKDYPPLVAHQLLSKIVDEFLAAHPRSSFASANPQPLDMPQLKEYIVKYQDPQQADSIMKIQRELDETKIVLHKTIESVLERGEKIDTLVEKSNDLSAQSRMFYGQVSIQRLRTDPTNTLLVAAFELTLSSVCRPRSRTHAVSSCSESIF